MTEVVFLLFLTFICVVLELGFMAVCDRLDNLAKWLSDIMDELRKEGE